ncbi:MAG: hypothetical protein ABR915_13155 [Thermoguttaceae bacterium]|jgi:hypothetical protein
MSQLLTTATTGFDRPEVPAARGPADPSERVFPRRSSRPRRPRFVFSPALIQYFAELHGRQVRIDGGHVSD